MRLSDLCKKNRENVKVKNSSKGKSRGNTEGRRGEVDLTWIRDNWKTLMFRMYFESKPAEELDGE